MRFLAGVFGGLMAAVAVQGQSTSSVYSPDVVKGRHAVEYRAAFDAETDDFSHRIHYQYGFTESLRGRIIFEQDKPEGEDFDFQFVRLEVLWQFLEDEEAGFDSALRFEGELGDGDDSASRFRIGWTNKIDLDDNWQLRGILKTGHEFGENSDDGFIIDLRAQVSRKVTDALRVGVEYFGDLNTTDDIGSFEEQEHQLGPLVKFNLGSGWKGQAGPLFGLSDAASDAELRLFLIKEF
ncbi:MAG: transporter [Opitutales bacterium]